MAPLCFQLAWIELPIILAKCSDWSDLDHMSTGPGDVVNQHNLPGPSVKGSSLQVNLGAVTKTGNRMATVGSVPPALWGEPYPPETEQRGAQGHPSHSQGSDRDIPVHSRAVQNLIHCISRVSGKTVNVSRARQAETATETGLVSGRWDRYWGSALKKKGG